MRLPRVLTPPSPTSCGDLRFDGLFGGALEPLPDTWSSVTLHPRPSPPPPMEALTLMSWNLLAPPYVRSGEADWRARAARQLDEVAAAAPDVLCLQEFWHKSAEHTAMWENFARAHAYHLLVSPRPGGKEDGCAMLLRGDAADVRVSALHFGDWGNRVVQVAEFGPIGRRLVLLNSHLTFPHASAHDRPMRFHQGRKLGEYARALRTPCVVVGDLNGDEDDAAVGVLRARGGLTPMPPPLSGGGTNGWVSHVSHRGDEMACDHVLAGDGVSVAAVRLGGSAEGLRAAERISDHRPVHARLEWGRPGEEE